MALATLSIDLVAKLANFEAGMDKAAHIAQRTSDRIEAGFRNAGNVIAGLGIAAAVTAQIDGIRAAIDRLDAIDDMAEKFGIATETLSAFGYASEVAGTAADAFGVGLGKLSKNMVAAVGGDKDAAAFFDALGVSIKNADGSLRDQAATLLDIAEKFAGYEDGAAKAALAQAGFGKTGADMIPLLNKGRAGIEELTAEAERFGLVVSGDAAAAAGTFGDTLKRLELSSKSFQQAVAIGMLPTLQALAETMGNVDGKAKDFNSTAGDIGRSLSAVVSFVTTAASGFYNFGRAIGGAAAAAAAFASLDFAGAKAISRSLDEDLGAARDKLGDFYRQSGDEYRKEMAERQRLADIVGTLAEPKATKRAAPVLSKGSDSGANKAANDAAREAEALAKAIRDNALRNEERYIAAERDLAAQRVRFLDTYNAQGLVSIQSYYDARRAITDEATKAQVAAYDREIAALREQQDKAKKASEKTGLQGQIDEKLNQRKNLVRDAGIAGIEAAIQQAKAEDDLRLAVAGVNAELEQMRGNIAASAAARFDAANAALKQSLTINEDKGGLAALEARRALTIAHEEYAEKATESQYITESLRIAEERIALSERLGAITTIEAIRQTTEARQRAVLQMGAVVTAQDAIARASESPAMVQQAERARLALEQLQATADVAADRISTVFESAANDALGGFIGRTHSASDAFKSFADSIIRDLSRIASQQITSGFTGKGGILGSLLGRLGVGGGESGSDALIRAMTAEGYAKGGVFGAPEMFASGGIVNRATPFRFASGGAFRAGVMGEAGPEAILPLQRMSNGRLGVVSHGAGSAPKVTLNVINHGEPVKARSSQRQTPDGVVIDLVLDAVAADIRSGGRVANAGQQQWGLSRAAGTMRPG